MSRSAPAEADGPWANSIYTYFQAFSTQPALSFLGDLMTVGRTDKRFLVTNLSEPHSYGSGRGLQVICYNGRIFHVEGARNWYKKLPQETQTALKSNSALWQALLEAQWNAKPGSTGSYYGGEPRYSDSEEQLRAGFAALASLLDRVVKDPGPSGLIARRLIAKRNTGEHAGADDERLNALKADFTAGAARLEEAFKAQLKAQEDAFNARLKAQEGAFKAELKAQLKAQEAKFLRALSSQQLVAQDQVPASPSTLTEDFSELGTDAPARSESDVAGVFTHMEDMGMTNLLKRKGGSNDEDFEIVFRKARRD